MNFNVKWRVQAFRDRIWWKKNVEFRDSSGSSESEQDYDIEELENFDSSDFSERSNSSDSEVNICVGDSYSSFAKKKKK